MNYRDYFKKEAISAKLKDEPSVSTDPKELEMGIKDEMEHTTDKRTAEIIAKQHLAHDPHYYSKMRSAGIGEEEQEECGMEEHCGGEEEGEHGHDEFGNDLPYDDYNDGLPKLGGALSIPHLGDPIRMAKIISVGPLGKGPASGELSGYSNVEGGSGKGVAKDEGGIPAQQAGDVEPITAGGKKTDGGIASKSVGGPVTPGEGQEQGGKNTVGTIANTAKLDEGKARIRKEVKRVLKEIRFNRETGKWEKINENVVDMKMGPSYKVAPNPTLQTPGTQDLPRIQAYDPEITEMYDDEEECMMRDRYTELVNAGRNLNEEEITEMNKLSEKLEQLEEKKKKWLQKAVDPEHKGFCTPMTKKTCTPRRKAFAMRAKHGGFEESGLTSEAEVNMKMGPSYKVVQQTLAKTSEPDQFSRTNEYDPKVSEGGEPSGDMKLSESEIQALMKEEPALPAATDAGGAGEPGGFTAAIGGLNPQSAKELYTALRNSLTSRQFQTRDGVNVAQQLMKAILKKFPELTKGIREAGIGAVQHSSYRTVDHGNLPQKPDQRWADDLDEVTKKVSKVVKTIQKGMKPKKTKKDPKLKFKPTKHTTSGIHKRKTK